MTKSKHFQIGCGRERAKVVVAQVSCVLRSPRRLGDSSAVVYWCAVKRVFGPEIATKHKENEEYYEQIEVPGLVGNVAVA